MTDDEIERYLSDLMHVLRTGGYGWVVDEVQAAISAGKLIEKKISERSVMAFERLPGGDTPRSRPKRASRASTTPFSLEEQLELLLEAIENATSNRGNVEVATLEILADVQEISFVPDRGDLAPVDEGSAREHRVSRDDRPQVRSISERSNHLINQIRSQLRDH
jgi:hypothetical protein